MERVVDDSYFDLPAQPPVPFGTSPFRAKGVSYLALLEFADEHVRGGRAVTLEQLRPAGLRRFMSQRFESSSWYDAVPIAYLAVELAALRGVSVREQLRDSNRYAFNSKIGKLYNALLSVLSPQLLATAIPRAAVILHDFGPATSRVVGPRRVEAVRFGIPRVLARWCGHAAPAYMLELLQRTGARAPRVELEPARPSVRHGGTRAGQELFDLTWIIGWE